MKSIVNLSGAASILTTLLLAGQLSACGQKGPLYLPAEPPPKPAQATPQSRSAPAPVNPAASAPAAK